MWSQRDFRKNGRAAAGSLLHVKTEHDGMPEASNEICTSPSPASPGCRAGSHTSSFSLLFGCGKIVTPMTPRIQLQKRCLTGREALLTNSWLLTAERQLRTATTNSSKKPSASRLRTLEAYERNCNACIEFKNILRTWHRHTGPAESQAVASNTSQNRSSHHHDSHRRRLQAFSALTNATFTPLAGCSTMSDLKPGKDSFLSSILSYVCKIRVTVYAISVNANCWPMQIRGPPLKGMYLRDAVSLSHV